MGIKGIEPEIEIAEKVILLILSETKQRLKYRKGRKAKYQSITKYQKDRPKYHKVSAKYHGF